MLNNQQTLRKEDMESINRVDGELTWLVQSKSDINMESINCLPCSEAYRGVDGELTWLVQSKNIESMAACLVSENTGGDGAPTWTVQSKEGGEL